MSLVRLSGRHTPILRFVYFLPKQARSKRPVDVEIAAGLVTEKVGCPDVRIERRGC